MTPWVKRLIIANVAIFFLESVGDRAIGAVLSQMVLVPSQVLTHPWTLVTYMFLHGGLMHIGFNMYALFMFGPRVEERLGARRFLTLYFLSGICGALLSLVFARNAQVIGASGALFGVMLAFAMYWPDVQILLFFFLPMSVRVAVIGMAVLSLWSGINGSRSGIADFAHLGGFAGGYLYLKWLEQRAGTKKFRTRTVAAVPKETLANYKHIDAKSIHVVNRDEVNRILDKINSTGLGSLTPQERLFLSNFVPPDDRVPPPT
ncbi:MAG: rhomboid family intramembrane serine protease [Gemmatimonadaceae bacterium]